MPVWELRGTEAAASGSSLEGRRGSGVVRQQVHRVDTIRSRAGSRQCGVSIDKRGWGGGQVKRLKCEGTTGPARAVATRTSPGHRYFSHVAGRLRFPIVPSRYFFALYRSPSLKMIIAL